MRLLKFIKIALFLLFSPFFFANVFTDAFDAEQELGIFGVKNDITGVNSSQIQAICVANGGRNTIWLRRYAGQSSAQVLSAE